MHVLLLSWADEDPATSFREELKDLANVFSKDYAYPVSTAFIPSKSASTWLMRTILDFIDIGGDTSRALKILCYGGQSIMRDDSGGCVWFK